MLCIKKQHTCYMGKKIFRSESGFSEESVLTLNNAEDVLLSIQSPAESDKGLFLTMVQGNAYSEVVITDSNIMGNSKFIMDIWD